VARLADRVRAGDLGEREDIGDLDVDIALRDEPGEARIRYGYWR
jgi:hypothetical protein